MKKVLFVFIIGLFLLTGCNSTSKYNKPIELDFNSYKEKIDNKDDFVLLIFMTGCSHCEEFEPTLNKIIEDYNLEVYSINTAKTNEVEYEKLKNKTFLTGTPTLVIFKKGKYFTRIVGSKSEETTIEFLKENKIIK